MISINMLMDMILTEAISPDTHQCSSCGLTFSQDGEGCPSCGKNASVLPISEPLMEIQEKPTTGE